MNHNTASIPEGNSLNYAGCRALNAKILCGPFLLNVIIVFMIMSITLSVQGAQDSLQTYNEWLPESLGSSLGSSGIHVAKRQTELSQEKSTVNVDTVETGTLDPSTAAAVAAGDGGGGKAEDEQTPKDDGAEDKTQPAGEGGETDKTSTEPSDDHKVVPGLKGISSEAVLRGFYVFVGVGTIVLLYIVIKLLRLRRRRATRKYRVLSHNDDQEMFPLAADDGDDEEIFNAADHQTLT